MFWIEETKPYQRGCRAYYSGDAVNPYLPMTPLHWLWKRGFNDNRLWEGFFLENGYFPEVMPHQMSVHTTAPPLRRSVNDSLGSSDSLDAKLNTRHVMIVGISATGPIDA